MADDSMNKRKIITKNDVILYCTGLFLICFYFFVLTLTINPQVDYEYKKYYIKKSLKEWGGPSSFQYALNTPLKFYKGNESIYTRISTGWSNLEEDGCWTDGDSAQIWFSDLPNIDLSISMQVIDTTNQGEINIYGNGSLLFSICKNDLYATKVFDIALPKEILSDGNLELYLDITDPSSALNDSRKMGIKVKEIVIHE